MTPMSFTSLCIVMKGEGSTLQVTSELWIRLVWAQERESESTCLL